MLKIIKNKKGFIINPIVLLVCFITFVIVGFIFYILFGLVGNLVVYNIESSSQSSTTHYTLLNYLRTPIEVNGEKMDMADLIVSSVNANNYDTLIEKTKEILGKEDIYYSIEVYDQTKWDPVNKGEKAFWSEESAGLKVKMHSSEGITSDDKGFAEISIPNHNTNIPLIKIFFYYGKGRPLNKEEQTDIAFTASTGV